MRQLGTILHRLIVWMRVLRWRRANPHSYRLMVLPTYHELSNRYDWKRWMR